MLNENADRSELIDNQNVMPDGFEQHSASARII